MLETKVAKTSVMGQELRLKNAPFQNQRDWNIRSEDISTIGTR